MPDTSDNHELQLLARGANPDYRPEVVTYPYVDFGLEVSKQRLLSAHFPFLPPAVSERERISYLSSCISFDSPPHGEFSSPLMVSSPPPCSRKITSH
ncbi:mutS protein homolog 5-like [Salmo trutta]|uniref:mutS protein homolog 5-like n=1 Tax=Salmo trutta TaxID=8032 RepID=UPI00113268B9|nr:mutS protein homolog 5-like [Salmo trutta]